MLSPRHQRYKVTLDGVTSGVIAPREFSSVGGFTTTLSQSECYVQSAGNEINDMLIRVWDAQTLQAAWTAVAPPLPTASLQAAGAGIAGTIHNGADRPLKNACLVYRDQVWQLGDIQPGKGASVTGRSQALVDYVETVTPEAIRGFGRLRFQSAQIDRSNADNAARYVSLFAHLANRKQSETEEILDKKTLPGYFTRYVRLSSAQQQQSVTFDLPAVAQLPDTVAGP